LGRGVEPPVDQVEVVARLVDHQPAGVALVAVPAAEVVGAVAGVEEPLEVDGEDAADRAGLEQLLDSAVARGVAEVEGDGEPAASGRAGDSRPRGCGRGGRRGGLDTTPARARAGGGRGG